MLIQALNDRNNLANQESFKPLKLIKLIFI